MPYRLLTPIRSEAAADPDIARRAAYWLPGKLDVTDPATVTAVRQLRADYPAAEPLAGRLVAV